jgi:hypothetical protein
MFSVLPLMLCCAGDISGLAALKDVSAESLGVAVTAEATPTNAHGLQIVSVRIRSIHVDPRPEVDWNIKLSQLKLIAATRHPETRIDVIYPKERENEVYCKEEVAIQVIIQRAEGDQSPVQGRLDFSVNRVFS